ncbi:MAG: choline-sulfatase [Opitutae bacterium]|nr:choline-sulfatase [Opitutae bacterium]|tara:strand:+ start:636 stop:2018 length:1383 start_codon:yes stop_codon:yes gene_type:complete
MKRFLGLSFTLFVLMALDARSKPNVLLIVTDDQRSDTIASLGNEIIDTPNLDRLVKWGTTFEQATCANPLCVPSRAEILTGCSSFRNGVLGMGGERIDPKLTLLPTAMASSGYHAWYSGKWMNDGKPLTRGYHETQGLFGSGGGTWKKGEIILGRKGRPVTGYRNWTFKDAKGKPELDKGIGLTPLTDKYVADGALKFLKRKTDKPFFLHVNFTGPHDPLIYPPGYEDKYKPADLKLPPNFLPRHPFDHGNFEGRDEQLLPWPRTKEDVLDELSVYYAVIDHIDKQVGRIIGQLRADGRLKNTYVIFTSDHGLALGSHGLMGKQNMYEHTIRVPLVIAGPKVPAGKRSDALCYLRDLYPTICDLAGIAIPESVEGKSLKPVIIGKQDAIYSEIYGYFRDKQRMVRNTRYKLIHYPHLDRHQLFDLQKDPHERNDLSGDKRHNKVLRELQDKLATWLDRND